MNLVKVSSDRLELVVSEENVSAAIHSVMATDKSISINIKSVTAKCSARLETERKEIKETVSL